MEGFNAAHKERISVASLAQDAEAAERIDGDRNFRIADGYKTVADFSLQGSPEDGSRLLLNTVVTAVHWGPGHARVEARSTLTGTVRVFETRHVIVTIPLGVLRAGDFSMGGIRFDPVPGEIASALEALEVGQVTRLVFRFKNAWWEDHD